MPSQLLTEKQLRSNIVVPEHTVHLHTLLTERCQDEGEARRPVPILRPAGSRGRGAAGAGGSYDRTSYNLIDYFSQNAILEK